MQQLSRIARPWLVGAAILTCSLVLGPQQASAADQLPVRLTLNENEIAFDANAKPFIENQRTMVPVRFLLEAIGAKVEWVQETQQIKVTHEETQILFTVDSAEVTVNGEPYTLDVPARVINERTYVPLRFFAEKFGMRVGWQGETHTVALSYRGLVQGGESATIASRGGERTGARQGQAMADMARNLVGLGYAWGGTSPDTGFDCSGFVYYLAGQQGVTLPHSSFDMFSRGEAVARENLQPGDLVFFTTYTDGPSHVGVYMGDGTFVHAENENTGVKVTSMSSPWWAPRYLGARRLFN